MAKKCQFLARISIFWVPVVSLCLPYPFMRELDSENDVCMLLNPYNNVFGGRCHKKNTIFRSKVAKKYHFFYPKSAFPRSRWSIGDHP